MDLRMFKKLTMIMFFSLVLFVGTSCEEKSFSSKNNMKAQILKDLNKSEFNTVINKLESKSALSIDENYLLASAYAMKGGMSVYSLYPLLEMELFHKRALDWGDLDSQKNPYEKFLIKENVRRASHEEKLEAWESYLSDYKSVKQLTSLEYECLPNNHVEYCTELKMKLDVIRENIIGNKYEYTDDSDYALNDEARKLDEVEGFMDKQYNLVYSDQDTGDNWEEQNEKIIALDRLGRFYKDIVVLDYKRDLFFAGEEDKGSADSAKMMNFLWSVYESIPIIQRLPKINNLQQDALTTTLEILKENLKKEQNHEKSLKMIVMTLVFSMSSAFADSFELESVNNPFEMGCHMKEDKYISYYPLLRKRVEFLTTLGEEGLLDDEVSQETVAPVKAYLQSTSDVISVQEKSEILLSQKKFKINNCDPQIYLQKDR